MNVELVRAWPRRYIAIVQQLPAGSRVSDALDAAGRAEVAQGLGLAIHGVRADANTLLRDGDRIELLRPLLADPKDARRRRAQARLLPR